MRRVFILCTTTFLIYTPVRKKFLSSFLILIWKYWVSDYGIRDVYTIELNFNWNWFLG